MKILPKVVSQLIDEFQKLPGVGNKSAARMAYYYLKEERVNLEKISELFITLSSKVFVCENCCNYSDETICAICKDPERNQFQILVVEEPLDAIAFEDIGTYYGVYHVLGGVISPVNGVGVNDLNIQQLINRLEKITNNDDIDEIEVILATTPNMEGEATSTILKNKILSLNDEIKISTLARGLPSGANIEYADKSTLENAFNKRNQM